MIAGAVDFFEMPPILYSKTASQDAVTRMQQDLENGDWVVTPTSGKEFLRAVLDRLNVPVESQVLVFSKTSLQNSFINHKNPRAIYFSNDIYVAWVPGGKIELIAEDAQLGPVFYTLTMPRKSKPPLIKRETDSCLQCHADSRTEGVPGLFIRSVIPDKNSHALLNYGTTLVHDSTPIQKRWGGWYVTGKSDSPHLGNQQSIEGENLIPQKQNVPHLNSFIDTTKYLQPESDIVALMILEHQCRIHNLLTKAKYGYRRATWFQKSIQQNLPINDPNGMSWKNADQSADEILSALLFEDEIELEEDGVQGGERFKDAFLSRDIAPSSGRGLRSLKLYRHLFKYRCSYMIYSKAFRHLPKPVKERVIIKLKQALSDEGTPKFAYLSLREKQKIRAILNDTLPSF